MSLPENPRCGARPRRLVDFSDPTARLLAIAAVIAVAAAAVLLGSNDARADYSRLQGLGIQCIGAPVEFRPGVWVFYFRGPDGEVCELREA